MNSNIASELVHRVPRLATLPELHVRLMAMLLDPSSALQDLAPLIQKDPGLTAQLLKHSNSAYYGRFGKVGTVDVALEVLGMGLVREVIVTAAIQRVFQDLSEYLLDMRGFWRHSVAVSHMARELAVLRNKLEPADVQIAGLLHDVGRLVLITVFPTEYQRLLLLARASATPLELLELENLGCTHGQVGGALFESWGLPRFIVQTVRHHHQPELSGTFQELVTLVQLADVLVHGLELGCSGESRIPPFRHAVCEELGLPFDRLAPLLSQVLSTMECGFDRLVEN